MKNKLLAEFIGTATLLIAVIGSSFAAQNLTQDAAVALLVNAAVTAAILLITINVFLEVSGSHFNPAVTLALALTGRFPVKQLLPYWLTQLCGAFFGAFVSNIMFSESIFELSTNERVGYQNLIGEAVATLGLIALALFAAPQLVWKFIPLWIFGAYFFTSSTSFANPAVTAARSLTSAPAGIAPTSVLNFVVIQFMAALVIAFIGRGKK